MAAVKTTYGNEGEYIDRPVDPKKVAESAARDKQSRDYTKRTGGNYTQDVARASITHDEYERLPTAAREKVDEARARSGINVVKPVRRDTIDQTYAGRSPLLGMNNGQGGVNSEGSRSTAGFTPGYDKRMDKSGNRMRQVALNPQARMAPSNFANAAVLNRMIPKPEAVKLPASVQRTASPTQTLNPFVFSQLINQLIKR